MTFYIQIDKGQLPGDHIVFPLHYLILKLWTEYFTFSEKMSKLLTITLGYPRFDTAQVKLIFFSTASYLLLVMLCLR